MVFRTYKRQLIFWIEAILALLRKTPPPLSPVQNSPKAFLIVKLDALGDYLLYRNTILPLKNQLQEEECLIFICNKICKPIIEELDPDLFDAVYYLDINDIRWKQKKRKAIWDKINTRYSITTIFHPTHSRRFIFDYFLKGFGAIKRIGVKGNLRNSNRILSYLGAKTYSHLVEFSDPLFEFNRNKLATEKALGINITIDTPYLPKLVPFDNNFDRWVVFPEASVKYREWDPKNFAQLIDNIYIKYSKQCTLVGVNKAKASEIISNLKDPNSYPEILTGKTRLIDLIKVIQFAKIVISNETVASQIAGIAKTKLVCLTYGEDFGNFIPYPKEMESPMIAIKPEKTGKINTISCESVMKSIEILAPKK